ncbi:MAG: beta-ketoacyl-[acyl-carrier-protein] synthase family protein [Polyangia bacterium]
MGERRRQVAVTGLGIVSALGVGLAAFRDGLRSGRSGVRELTLFPTDGVRTHLAAQCELPVVDLDPALVSNLSRPDAFGLASALEAIRDAGLDANALYRAALVMGTGAGGAQNTEDFVVETRAGGRPAASRLVPHQSSSVTDLVGRAFGVHGPRSTIMTACSSSATAIGYAGDRIRLGHADIALAGGAEPLCRLTYLGFNALRATSPEPCRPFDRDRKGLNLGEGGAMLVLEELEHAKARGAKIYALLGGYGITADAHHMTAPHPEGDGAARAMIEALRDAGIDASRVSYVNAHGTATPHNDAAETHALRRVFGAHADKLMVSSIKSMVGHTLGAAGAVEAVASCLTISEGFIPPTVNLENVDPAFGALDYCRGDAREVRVDALLSNSFAFGGNNTSLAFLRA